MDPKDVRVTIINHTSGNKGDRAMLVALLRDMARLGYRRFTVSMDRSDRWAADALDALSVQGVVPWGWSRPRSRVEARLRRLRYVHLGIPRLTRALERGHRLGDVGASADPAFVHALHSADLIISVGGHRVTTLLSPNLATCQAHDLALAALSPAPLLLWSQTVGPVAPSAHRFVRAILNRASVVAPRDADSVSILGQLGVDGCRVVETVDSAFSLSDLIEPVCCPSQRPPVVGCAVYAGMKRTPRALEEYVSVLGSAIASLADRGHSIRFIPMSHDGADIPTIERVIAMSRCPSACSVADPALAEADHLAEFARVRWVLGHKTHSVILSLAVGTPVLALAYHPKTHYFMEQFGLSAHCLDAWPAPRASELSDAIVRLSSCDLNALSRGMRSTAHRLAARVRRDLAQAVAAALEATGDCRSR